MEVGDRLEGAAPRPGAMLVLPVSEGAANGLDVLHSLANPDVDVTWHWPPARGRLRDPDGEERRVRSERARSPPRWLVWADPWPPEATS